MKTKTTNEKTRWFRRITNIGRIGRITEIGKIGRITSLDNNSQKENGSKTTN